MLDRLHPVAAPGNGRGLRHRRGTKATAGGLAVVVCVLAAGASATRTDGYLAQFVLMMDWVNRSVAYVSRHRSDTALAGVAHAVAERLVEKAQRLTPPERLADLHPHFLLALENAERAFHHLSVGAPDRARQHLAVVREEIANIRRIQRDLGIVVPDLTL